VPRNRDVAAVIDRATLRARWLVAAEAAAVGAVVASWSVAVGFAAATALAVWRSRAVTRRAVLRVFERADPRASNVITTADELATGALGAKPEVRQRVDEDAVRVLSAIDTTTVLSVRPLLMLTAIAVLTWSASALTRRAATGIVPTSVTTSAGSPVAAGTAPLQVTVRVEPPGYTHLKPTIAVDPTQIDAIERSAITLSIATNSDNVTVDHGGELETITPRSPGRFEFEMNAQRSGYLLVVANGARRMMTLAVKPDALPLVTMTAPARDLVYEGGNPTITFAARATDDFGLRSLVLRFTKVSGSGEQFAFTDGEIPLAIARDDDRQWSGATTRSLASLTLAEGDMLVYRAVASDMRPAGAEASSEAFYIEVSKLGVAAGDAFTLPEQETRYALSQQMLIVKTDRLNQHGRAMARSDFEEAARSLAVEQRMIRSEFVFMLGGEIADEEVEAEQSVEIQAGRLANRGQRDIRAATIAMSQAEKLLSAADTASALKAERAAVEALQRAFARDRYILRALASRSQLDLTRRLSGSPAGVTTWRRDSGNAAANRVGAGVQSLLQGLAEATTREQTEVLAEFAVRLDAESADLRAIAADLQRIVDSWSAASNQREPLQAVADRVVALSGRTLADPPVAIGDRR